MRHFPLLRAMKDLQKGKSRQLLVISCSGDTNSETWEDDGS